MIPIKSNLSRANTAKVVFYLLLTISIISFYSLFVQYQLLTDAKNGLGISQQAASANQMRQTVVAVVNSLLLFTSLIVFLMWVYRAYENLTNLKITSLNFTPGWAIGYWFVPIMSLYRPHTVMREVWEETQGYTFSNEEKHNITPPTLVSIWWTLNLINIFVSYFVILVFRGDSSIDGLLTLTLALMIAGVFTIIVKIVTLVMINKIVIFEKDLLTFVKNSNDQQLN
ncbi:MAG: DUF4328 domain-containing protein [Bacteroidota bacterium]